jgi:hypothetical protein
MPRPTTPPATPATARGMRSGDRQPSRQGALVTVHVVEALSIQLVQDAPELDGDVVAQLRTELERIGSPLALTISRIVELVHEGLVDPAISLPAIAEACATLAAGVHGTVDQAVLDAAQYQIDTLTPMPDKPRALHAVPDVPLTSLKRRDRE